MRIERLPVARTSGVTLRLAHAKHIFGQFQAEAGEKSLPVTFDAFKPWLAKNWPSLSGWGRVIFYAGRRFAEVRP